MPDKDAPPLDPGVDLWTDKVCGVIGQPRVAPGPPAPPVDMELVRRWEQRSRIAEPDVMDVLSRRLGETSRIRAAWMQATELANGGRHEAALKVLDTVERLVGEAVKSGPDPTEGVPKDVVPFVKARLTWNKTRKKLNTELAKLEQAIIAVCGTPELAYVKSETGPLYDHIAELDERLEDALDAIANATEGDERETTKLTARALVGEYRTVLQEPFFQDIDTNNGFAKVSVTASATEALQMIEQTIA